MLIDIDPRELRLPPSRPMGADAYKLQRQIALFLFVGRGNAAALGLSRVRRLFSAVQWSDEGDANCEIAPWNADPGRRHR
jgi:hypothetical protein